MKQNRTKNKHSLLDRVSTAVCLGIYILAIVIFCWSIGVREDIRVAEDTHINEETALTTEAHVFAVEGTEKENIAPVESHVTRKEKPRKLYFEECEKVDESQATEPENIPVIENIQGSISEWCMSHENEKTLTIWKMTDEEGNLFVALKNNKNEFVVTFKYEGVESQEYNGWTLCNEKVDVTTTRDIIDYAFTAYHEVSGNNSRNVQAQVAVLMNRQKSKNFPDSIRGVVTERGQYACAKSVVNRRLKSSNYLEREDLGKCFQQTILVLAGEVIQEVPIDVVFAATGRQGSGTWDVIDGTYYCYQ